MVADSIEREILVEAPPSVVWRVLTEPDYIQQWFEDVAELDLQPGGDGVLVGRSNGHSFPLVFEEVEPERRLSWRWVHPEGREPHPGNSVLVVFTLTAEGEHTRLHLSESGWNETDWADDRRSAFVAGHEEGWTGYVEKLANVAATALASAR